MKILDPQKEFSDGGPSWDFVENAYNTEIRNQMAVFGKVMKDFSQRFEGTIIRIPLRTFKQAENSKIWNKSTTVSDVKTVMNDFVSDFGISGLLFMKHVERIVVMVDDEELAEIGISNAAEIRQQKGVLNETIRDLCQRKVNKYSLSFEVNIETRKPGSTEETKFCVHQMIGEYPENGSLKEWSMKFSFLPWVAVAGPILPNSHEVAKGSFFTVLPLPIETKQPVHIHGHFSLSSNRAQLYQRNDPTVQDKLPVQWNEWLLHVLVPEAWTNMLLYLAKEYPDQSAYRNWPRFLEDSKTECFGLIGEVLKIIEDGNLPLWYTNTGYKKAKDALFGSGHESPSPTQIAAFGNVGVPVIHMTDDLRIAVSGLCKAKPLNAQNLCSRLDKDLVRGTTEHTKQILLDYILSDDGFGGYGEIEIFPFEDGTYKSIEHNAAFVHRNEHEQELFSRESGSNIDLVRLSTSTKEILQQKNRALHPSLKHRSARDLQYYCLSTIFKDFDTSDDKIILDKDGEIFVSKIWEWIEANKCSLDEDASCLWLVPLSDGSYRKLKPRNVSSNTIYAPTGEIGDFIRKLATFHTTSNRPILQAANMSPEALKCLTEAANSNPALGIGTVDSFEGFTLWLSEVQDVITLLTDVERKQLQELLALSYPKSSIAPFAINTLRGLNIFQKLVWNVYSPTS